MAKQFFKDLPDTTTPLTATRLNGLLDGEEALGNIVVDSIRSKNLCNIYTNQLEASISSTDGTIISAQNNACGTNYISVKPNTSYIISANTTLSALRLSEYTSQKTHIQRNSQNNVSSLIITTSANTYYLRWSVNINDTTTTIAKLEALNLQLEQGSTATTYTPYQELNPDNFKNEEIVVGSIRSKNMFDGILEQGAYGFGDGANISTTNYCRSVHKIPVIEGKTYTLSFVSTIPITFNDCGFVFFNNDTYVSGQSNILTVTVPSGANYMVFNISAYPNTITPSDISNVQVEEGSTATPYMSHQELNCINALQIKQNPTGNLNDYTENGIYWYNSGLSNIPPEQFGVLLVFVSPYGVATSSWWIVQIALSTGSNIYKRVSTDEGASWSSWIQI